MGILPARKYAVDTEELITTVTALAAAPLVAARSLYLQFVFAWLTGNGDLHAKNVSLLQGEDGRWAVAPIYDVPSTVPYGDLTTALRVDGRDSTVRRRHWEALADGIGLRQKAAEAVHAMALKAAARIDLAAIGFEGSQLRGTERELRHRRYELEG